MTTKKKTPTAETVAEGLTPDTTEEWRALLEEVVEGQELGVLTTKLLAIMRDCDRIPKDRHNKHHDYWYSSEKAIKEALHPLFVKHRVLYRMAITGGRAEGPGLLIPMEYVFQCADTGVVIREPWMGSGHDRDEKGLYAAITGAQKYSVTTSFFIPTGADPEGEDRMLSEPPPPRRLDGKPPNAKDYSLQCAACATVVQLSEVRTSKANFDTTGMINEGETGYFCPDPCKQFQSVNAAVKRCRDHTEAAGSPPEPTISPETPINQSTEGKASEAELKVQHPIPEGGNDICLGCGKKVKTKDGHGDCTACALPF
jgi:hypothetical protein